MSFWKDDYDGIYDYLYIRVPKKQYEALTSKLKIALKYLEVMEHPFATEALNHIKEIDENIKNEREDKNKDLDKICDEISKKIIESIKRFEKK